MPGFSCKIDRALALYGFCAVHVDAVMRAMRWDIENAAPNMVRQAEQKCAIGELRTVVGTPRALGGASR